MARRGGSFTTMISAEMWLSLSQLTVKFKGCVSGGIKDVKKQNFVQGFQQKQNM
jgi:hypothetical protein